ncbi:MAG: sel1 repeat family protein [Treponema sp.]|nr:sel1 repeat family protein [Treponema sp.]
MNTKKMIVTAAVLMAAAYGFSDGKLSVNFAFGTQKNAFDYPNEKQVYGITLGELKDIVKNGGVHPAVPMQNIDEKALVSESDAKKILEDGKVDIEEIHTYAANGNPYFQFCLGRCYEHGQQVEKNYEEAVTWYTLSAEQGYRMAQNNLACMYLDGNGVPKDAAKAIYWFEKAAEKGDAFGYLNIGEMYQEGNGLPQDYKKALEYYNKAAAMDAPEAYDCIGHMYELGLGLSQSDKKAFKNFKKAAELDYAPCQYDVGVAYRDGIGVRKNLKEAKRWFSRAAEKSFEKAKIALEELQ